LDSMPDTSGLSFEERRSNFEEQVSQLPVAENDTVEIKTLHGAWRLDYLTFVYIKKIQKSDYLKYIATEDYVVSTFEISDFGRYYLKGDNSNEEYPLGIASLVIDQNNDTIRNRGKYASESDSFLIDMGILRPGDKVAALMGKTTGSDPSQWNVELMREPYYHSSRYPDPEELPVSMTSPLDQLEIFRNGHPRVFSFRKY